MKTVRFVKPYMHFPAGHEREMAARLADQLVKGGFVVIVEQEHKSLSAEHTGRAKRLELSNKAVGA
jgi:16S rRNA C1402 (ribose-2'-O) methylase RsmI